VTAMFHNFVLAREIASTAAQRLICLVEAVGRVLEMMRQDSEYRSGARIMPASVLNRLPSTMSLPEKTAAPSNWHRKESARAKIRLQVKKTLRKYGYRLDLESQAVITVLQQAAALAGE